MTKTLCEQLKANLKQMTTKFKIHTMCGSQIHMHITSITCITDYMVENYAKVSIKFSVMLKKQKVFF